MAKELKVWHLNGTGWTTVAGADTEEYLRRECFKLVNIFYVGARILLDGSNEERQDARAYWGDYADSLGLRHDSNGYSVTVYGKGR